MHHRCTQSRPRSNTSSRRSKTWTSSERGELDRLVSDRQHGADHVRVAGRVPAARLSGRLLARCGRTDLRRRRHRARPVPAGLPAGAARARLRRDEQRHAAWRSRSSPSWDSVLERSGMAEDLLDTIGQLFGTIRGGSPMRWCSSARCSPPPPASVAASVISMGLISLPIMLRYGYDRRVATGHHRRLRHTGADHSALARSDRDGRPARPLGRRHV